MFEYILFGIAGIGCLLIYLTIRWIGVTRIKRVSVPRVKSPRVETLGRFHAFVEAGNYDEAQRCLDSYREMSLTHPDDLWYWADAQSRLDQMRRWLPWDGKDYRVDY